MTLNEKSLFYDVVCQFEGFRSRPYRCPSGHLTIGYGHTEGVNLLSKVTKAEARKLLISDFEKVFLQLQGLNFSFYLLEHELFAIADFVFNLGYEKFRKSTLFTYLNSYCLAIKESDNKSEKYYQDLIIAKINEFHYYTDHNGIKKSSAGLLKRRKFESYLFEFGKVKVNQI